MGRAKLGFESQQGSQGRVLDILAWACCPCCSAIQEGRIVDEAQGLRMSGPCSFVSAAGHYEHVGQPYQVGGFNNQGYQPTGGFGGQQAYTGSGGFNPTDAGGFGGQQAYPGSGGYNPTGGGGYNPTGGGGYNPSGNPTGNPTGHPSDFWNNSDRPR